MEIINIKLGKDRKYTIVAEYYETYNSWGHIARVFKNNVEVGYQKIRYYNRTWETYQFQSAINSALNVAIDNAIERAITIFKYENEIERFKKGQKEQVLKEFKKTLEYKDLVKLKKIINDSRSLYEIRQKYDK